MIDLEAVHAAAARIDGYVRRTPLIKADQLHSPLFDGELWLKLECLQVTGSFKARGAMNRLLAAPPELIERGIVTASGGNHGIAVARAGHLAGVATTVFLPDNASPLKRAKLLDWGADVRTVGRIWDEADTAARAFAAERRAAYFHPFADPDIVAGQGTLALEILDELPDADHYLIGVGGGGLIAGMATVIRSVQPNARIIGIEPTGSPTLKASLDAGEVVSLPAVTTRVPTMACGRTDPRIFALVRRSVDDIVLIEDEAMVDAARWLWLELGLAADLSGAAACAALRSGHVSLPTGAKVCGLVCGAGTDGLGASELNSSGRIEPSPG
jgi:threonine dehydratase